MFDTMCQMVRTRIVEAIILTQKDFGEADRIVTIYAKQLGKVTVIARGVRRIKSRRGGNIDVLNHAILTLAHGQNLPIVIEAAVISSFQDIKSNLTKTLYAYYVLELLDAVTVEGEMNFRLFQLLKQTLDQFAYKPRRTLLIAFELKLLQTLGFLSIKEFEGTGKNIVALAGQFSVQSIKNIAETDYASSSIESLETIVRKKFATVAERELKSPQIIAQLKQTLSQIEEVANI